MPDLPYTRRKDWQASEQCPWEFLKGRETDAEGLPQNKKRAKESKSVWLHAVFEEVHLRTEAHGILQMWPNQNGASSQTREPKVSGV